MIETNFDIESAHRQSYSLGLSVGLHAAILFLMLFNFSWATNDFEKTPPAILMVDLSKVELGDKTNLPPEIKKKDTPKPVAQPKKEQPNKVEQPKPLTKTPTVKQEAPALKPEQVKPVEKPTPKDAVKVKEPAKPKAKEKPKKAEPKKTTPKKAPVKKTAPSKPAPKKVTPKKTTQTTGLQSLLASVDKVRKPANPAPAAAETENVVETGLEINSGIKGGTSGSRMEALTISEKDLIANKIRECWNVNAGVEGAEEMIIEIKAKVNRDGRIQDVRIVNMKNNPVFRSMAESARRAIYTCDIRPDSPFKMLAEKRPEHYSTWKEIHLRMNPVDGGVF